MIIFGLLPSDERRWIRFSEDGGVESPSINLKSQANS